MKNLKKLLAMLLCAGLLITSIPLKASAQSNEPKTGTIVHINPLYEGLVDESQFLNAAGLDDEAPALADTYYSSYEAAGADMREQLKDRKAVVTIGIKTGNSDVREVCFGLMDEAMKHTGVPDEGDYILWQYGGWSAQYSEISGGYSFSYEMDYYTTASQEAAVDRKLDQIFDSLDLEDASDYQKVKGIYDYICSNITYDYENLEDDSYMLKHSAYAGLIDGTCVCQGYALILYRMALTLGVDARLIAGDGGGPHGWNIVKLGDYYYNLDSTWDAGYTPNYSWFLLGSENFVRHYRYEDYETAEFHREFPTSKTDFASCDGSTDPDAHSYTVSRTEPTCTKAGSETEYCSVCGVKGSTTSLPALGHNYVDYVCTRCGDKDYPSSGTCGENASWELLADGTLLISGSGAISDDPSKNNSWFGHTEKISSIVISEGITSIGYGAFSGLNRATKLSLPSSLTAIRAYAFSDCISLLSVSIPDSVSAIDIGAFTGCRNLRTAVLPSSLKVIEAEAFANCAFLSSVTIPEGITEIKSKAFSGCTDLRKLTVPASVTAIHELAFSDSGLQMITFLGDAPSFSGNCFSGVNATAFIPSGNTSWTSSKRQNYGGSVVWRVDGEAITAPTVKASLTSAGKIKLTWNNVEGAVSYNVYRAVGSGDFGYLVSVTSNSYTDTSVSLGKTYRYFVTAVDVLNESSEESSTVSCTVTLTKPEVKSANVLSTGKIKLTWNKVTGAKEYQIYRSTSKNGKYTLMKTTEGTSYTNTSAKAGTYYYYKVKAVAKNEKASVYSNVVGRTCDLARPTLSLSNVASSGKIKVSWTKVEGAVKYQVQRATSKNGTYKVVKTTTSLSFTDTNTTAGKTYYYKVRAVHEKSAANSAYTGYKSRMCDLKRPTVSITASGGKPKVSWAAVTNAKEYSIYRATSKSGTYKLVKTTTNKSWKDTTAKKGKTYYYKVVAVHKNSAANSAYSNIVNKKCTK